jgi:gas vesicle protein
MNSTPKPPSDHHFAIGLLAGTCLGAALALWLAPRGAAEVRQRLTSSARRFRREAAERYQEARERAGDAVDDIARTGNQVRDGVADAVAHGANAVAAGAREVERMAKAARSSADTVRSSSSQA